MGWADHYVRQLLTGNTIVFRPRGNSMTPLIRSGQEVTVAPLAGDPRKGDVVLCRVKGAQYLHLVKAVQGDRFLIARADGHENGWVRRAAIYGVLTQVRS